MSFAPEDYFTWTQQEVAPRPQDRRRLESHASLDFDDEDAAWTALLAHARNFAYQVLNVDQWDALLADLPEYD